MAVNSYQMAKEQKLEIQKKLSSEKEKNEGIIKQFEESIENLKQVEVHEAHQTDKVKYLFDLYYSMEQMNEWKKNCYDQQEKLCQKVDSFSSQLKSLKANLKQEQEQIVQSNKKQQNLNSTFKNRIFQSLLYNSIQNLSIGMEPSIQDGKHTISKIFSITHESYRTLRKHIVHFLENGQNSSQQTQTYLSNIDHSNLVNLLESNKQLDSCDEHLLRLSKYYESLSNLQVDGQFQVIRAYNELSQHSGELNKISVDFHRYYQEQKGQIEKYFGYLLHPAKLPAAYQSCLSEVSRRNEYLKVFDQLVYSLNDMVQTQKKRRSQFQNLYGRVIPLDFIPGITNQSVSSINVTNRDSESLIPQIEGLHIQCYSIYLNNSSGGNNSQFQTDAQKQNELLRKEIQRLKEDLDAHLAGGGSGVTGRTSQSPSKRKDVNDMTGLNGYREKDKLIDKLKIEVEDLKEVISNTHAFYSGQKGDAVHGNIGLPHVSPLHDSTSVYMNLNSLDDQLDQKTLDQQNRKIHNLTQLLQQTAQSSYNIFMRKIGQRERKYTEIKSLLQKAQDEKSNLQQFYEEQVSALHTNADETENKLKQEIRSLNSQLSLLKEQIKEKVASFNYEADNFKKELKLKNEMIKAQEEMIKSLNESQAALSRELHESKDRLSVLENQIKSEQNEAISNLQVQWKLEREKLKLKINNLETDGANQSMEIEKLNAQIAESKRELNIKCEESSRVINESDNLQKSLEKLRAEMQQYANKIENQEIIIKNKTNDVSALSKTNEKLAKDQSSLLNELAAARISLEENQSKLLKLNQCLKSYEQQQNSTKSKLQKSEGELERKGLEIANLRKELEHYERKYSNTKQEFERLASDQEFGQEKIDLLTEQLNDKKVQLNAQQTQIELLHGQIQCLQRENESVRESMERTVQEQLSFIEKLQNEQENLMKQIQNVSSENSQILEQLNEVKSLNDQMLVESEILIQRRDELDSKNIQLLNLVAEKENEISTLGQQIRKKNETILVQQSKQKELTVLTGQLNELVAKLREKLGFKQAELQTVLENDVNALQDINSQKERELNDTLSELQKEKEQKSRLEKEIDQFNSIINQFDCQEQCYKDDQARARQEIEELKFQIEQSNSIKDQLTEQLALNRQLSQELELKLAQGKEEITILQGQINMMQNQSEKREIELNSSISEIRNNYENAIAENFELQNVQSQIYSKVETLESELMTSMQKISFEKSQFESETYRMTQKISEQEQTMAALESQLKVFIEQTCTNKEVQVEENEIMNFPEDDRSQFFLNSNINSNTNLNIQNNSTITSTYSIQNSSSLINTSVCITEAAFDLSKCEVSQLKHIFNNIENKIQYQIRSSESKFDPLALLKKSSSIFTESINFKKLEEGSKCLFIPFGNGLYTPLILQQITDFSSNKSFDFSNSLAVGSFKNNFFLDLDYFDPKYNLLLKECSLILIAKIQNIIPKKNASENVFGLKENECYTIIQTDAPQYIVGFEDEQLAIKNYA